MALGRGPEELICSSRGCESPAAFAITWSNPNLPFGRAKHWLACTDHREELERYLGFRNFPQETQLLSAFLSGRDEDAGQGKSTGVQKP